VAQVAAPATPAPVTAPAEYGAFTVPDDYVVSDGFKEIAKTLNLSQEQAQKAIDFDAKRYKDQQAAMAKTTADWAQAAKNDPGIGGEHFDANLGLAKKALEAFGSPELNQLLNQSGLGNHPELLRAFVKVGRAISEDRLVTGAAGDSAPSKSVAQRMYPGMNP